MAGVDLRNSASWRRSSPTSSRFSNEIDGVHDDNPDDEEHGRVIQVFVRR